MNASSLLRYVLSNFIQAINLLGQKLVDGWALQRGSTCKGTSGLQKCVAIGVVGVIFLIAIHLSSALLWKLCGCSTPNFVEDESGAVDMDEFLMGCLRVRGQARAIDITKMLGCKIMKVHSLLWGGYFMNTASYTSTPSDSVWKCNIGMFLSLLICRFSMFNFASFSMSSNTNRHAGRCALFAAMFQNATKPTNFHHILLRLRYSHRPVLAGLEMCQNQQQE